LQKEKDNDFSYWEIVLHHACYCVAVIEMEAVFLPQQTTMVLATDQRWVKHGGKLDEVEMTFPCLLILVRTSLLSCIFEMSILFLVWSGF
jgi:hypothetical protein